MEMKRKICVVTGTRAEYGRLENLMRSVKEDESLCLQIVATAMHLSPEYGLTYKKIEEDGFHIDEKIEMLLSSDSVTGVAKSIGIGIIGMADAFARLRPDIVVVLGDRYEALAAAQAAMVANIPIAHIHGGELTGGAIDDAIRHAITKMSNVHFVASDDYKKRILQMGEDPSKVFTVGSPGNDNIASMQFLDLDELERELGFSLGNKFFLVTYHPVTIQSATQTDAIKILFHALDRFPEYKIIFTKANSDAGGRRINQLIDVYTNENKHRVFSSVSLGQLRFLSAMKYSCAVIGNSSSGLLEAPLFHVPTVNIGHRQDGRKQEASVLSCGEDLDEIVQCIKKAVSKDFKNVISDMMIPYMDGAVHLRIKEILKCIDLNNLVEKKFFDM